MININDAIKEIVTAEKFIDVTSIQMKLRTQYKIVEKIEEIKKWCLFLSSKGKIKPSIVSNFYCEAKNK